MAGKGKKPDPDKMGPDDTGFISMSCLTKLDPALKLNGATPHSVGTLRDLNHPDTIGGVDHRTVGADLKSLQAAAKKLDGQAGVSGECKKQLRDSLKYHTTPVKPIR